MDTITSTTTSITRTVIPCKRDFMETRSALESLVPELDMSPIKKLVDNGDYNGAKAAIQALPPLTIFGMRPRNVNQMFLALDHDGQAIQYEIGSPYTAMRMTKYQPGVGLYMPIRVQLIVKGGADSKPFFEYDRPASTLTQFGDERVNEVAHEFDRNILQVLATAAGVDLGSA